MFLWTKLKHEWCWWMISCFASFRLRWISPFFEWRAGEVVRRQVDFPSCLSTSTREDLCLCACFWMFSEVYDRSGSCSLTSALMMLVASLMFLGWQLLQLCPSFQCLATSSCSQSIGNRAGICDRWCSDLYDREVLLTCVYTLRDNKQTVSD